MCMSPSPNIIPWEAGSAADGRPPTRHSTFSNPESRLIGNHASGKEV